MHACSTPVAARSMQQVLNLLGSGLQCCSSAATCCNLRMLCAMQQESGMQQQQER